MQNFQLIIAVIVAAALGYVLWRKVQASKQSALNTPQLLFGDIIPLVSGSEIEPGPTVGTWKLTGKYRGHVFQIQTVIDVLVTRKLPSLWLMVTLPEPQPVGATFDLMMRPAGPSTFSNFDFLENVIATPSTFPLHAVIRTDDPAKLPPTAEILPHLSLFFGPKGKELLISPKGLRVVVQAAQADRARYGVLREANFGAVVIDAELTVSCLNMLIDLNNALKDS
ncbi:MAG: hypothetical protein ABIN69_16770 [Aestuariivirga sp.]